MGDSHSIVYFGYGAAMDMDNTHYQPLDWDLSSGYLQDALFEFSSSKRRRLLLLPDAESLQPNTHESSPPSFPGCSSFYFDISYEHFLEFNNVKTTITDKGTVNESKTSVHNDINNNNSTTTPSSSSSSQSKSSINIPRGNEERKKKVITRMVYPFALIKPGGFEGDITLNQINEIILRPPTRPIKHPVGDIVCRPFVSSAGPSLSGKAVTALTIIQTQGRGTITIIRTKD